MQRIFSKKSNFWYNYPVKVKKTYTHIPDLMKDIVIMRLEDEIGMSKKMPLEPDDPRRISSTLANIPPPPTDVITQRKTSRFKTEGKEDPDATILYDP